MANIPWFDIQENTCSNSDLLFSFTEWKSPEILIIKFAQFLINCKNLIDIAKQTLFMMCLPIFCNWELLASD